MANKMGKVCLVGAGPGDISLITLKGMECIKHADVLVYDRLVNPELLTYAPANCELINVGKFSGNHPIPQGEINHILAEHAKAGKWVVRLKSGDPYVFGRGGEEAQQLTQDGIPFEVVPGVTSAIGGLSYAGIPVTHRDYASSFHVITGHLRSDKTQQDTNWQALAQVDGTLIILMGITNLPFIASTLQQYGKAGSTPAAIIMRASWSNQRVVTGTLATIEELAKTHNIQPPALIVIGEVVKLHDQLDFSPYLNLFKEQESHHEKGINRY